MKNGFRAFVNNFDWRIGGLYWWILESGRFFGSWEKFLLRICSGMRRALVATGFAGC